MRESSGDTTLLTSDGGIIMLNPGTVTASAFDTGQLGAPYNIKNASSGDVIVNSSSGEFFQEATGNVSTMTIPTNNSLQLGRNGTSPSNWVLQ